MTLAVFRKQAPSRTFKAEHNDARGTPKNYCQRWGGFSKPLMQYESICTCGGRCPRCKKHTVQTKLKIRWLEEGYKGEAEYVADPVSGCGDCVLGHREDASSVVMLRALAQREGKLVSEFQRASKPSPDHLVSTRRAVPNLPNRVRTQHPLMAQQQSLGNQAVQRLLSAGVIQAKLKIGQPGDPYEQEADRVAEAVMRMPEPVALEKAALSGQGQGTHIQQACSECEEELHRQPAKATVSEQLHGPRIQRVCSECEEELGEKPLEEEEEVLEELLQTKESLGLTPEVTPSLESRINALSDGGQPLPALSGPSSSPTSGTASARYACIQIPGQLSRRECWMPRHIQSAET